MAFNIAAKRAKAAARRKQALARKAAPAVPTSLAAQARRASVLPIQHCLLHGDADEGGMVSVVLARGSPHHVFAAIVLVDLHCLGVKDVIFRDFSASELALFCSMMEESARLTSVEPAYACKLLREAAAWGAKLGFKPSRDYAAALALFGDIDAQACDASFVFGLDGKPFYVTGPTETRAQVRRRLAHLAERLGPDGFDFMVGI